MSGVQDLHGGSQPGLQLAFQALGRSLVIADEETLHIRIPQHDPAPWCLEIGLRSP